MKKVFTEKKSNSTIKKKHNHLNMKKPKNEALEGLNLIQIIFFKKRFIEVYKKGVRRGFNWNSNIVR